MKQELKLLIVEDDNDQYDLYTDAIEELNEDDTDRIRIEITREKNSDNALQQISSEKFDGAIIDLNLEGEENNQASGNKVIRRVLEQHRFPIYIVSGNLGNLDNDIVNYPSPFITSYNRDDEVQYVEILKELKEIFKTGITKILGGRGLIEEHLKKIFWEHLANDYKNIASTTEQSSEKTLLRYALSHLSEYLAEYSDGESRYFHPAEYYIKPPIQKHIATGDIISQNNKYFINISPACDVAVRKVNEDGTLKINANKVILAPLIPVLRESFLEKGIIKADDPAKTIEKIIGEIVKGQRDKYALLPEYSDLNAKLIDLQNIETIEVNQYQEFNREATVAGIFLKDIQSRFSSYMARQGQPDLDKSILIGKYKNILKRE
ncbi:hypothetical protein [Pseudoalteromonas sp. NJ631]|uniref:hypothetical protein n=1 Tax=Pseudoalteromonas sp. NJ631 TaxID=493915 RepID=UPI00030C94E4|nr:hypothetical protein [Pseudoalteromonas sp. NJ631]